MIGLNQAEMYLTIPRSYGDALGGLWWTSQRDAIERQDGTTLAVTDELRAVLEGVIARSPVPHFAFVLNLLHLMKSMVPGFELLHRAFSCTRGVTNRGRNAGLLIAELCRGLPSSAGTVTGEGIGLALRSLRLYGEGHSPDAVPEPALTLIEFEGLIAHRLASFDDATLVHWLTHGCEPPIAGARLAEETESLPERMARLLNIARQRGRLVGAAALVPALDAAVTLPPRGYPPDTLPMGGYCDVTTRGNPERLLPSQFALDPDEFVRRFAGNELLYFKREEPHKAVRLDRVIVLDQGVRTWGSVRLALAAAAFSLIQADAKRCGPVRLFVTSISNAVDLLHPDLEAVAKRLEASDLTRNPSACLTLALRLDDIDPAPRDVILLTHPRCLREPSMVSAAAGRGPGDRLFAVTVDEAGRAELSEWGKGGPQALRSFRVDLLAAEAARAASEQPLPFPRAVGTAAVWTGDTEPVPFPFRPGLVAEPLQLGFTADGDWLVIAGRDGVLHGLAFDGTPPEVLPRPYMNEVVLKQVDAILGVSGGVVVCGRMAVSSGRTIETSEPASVTRHSHYVPVVSSGASLPPTTKQFVAAHYERATQRVVLHAFGPIVGEPQWCTHPDLHCVTLRTTKGVGCALDLSTLGRFLPDLPASPLSSRASFAWNLAAKGSPPFAVPVVNELPSVDHDVWDTPFLKRMSSDTLYLWQTATAWQPISPQRDGKPLLAGVELHRAQFAGDVLALAYANAGERKLLLLRGPDGTVLGEMAHPIRSTFALSSNGLMIARRDVTRAVAVSETAAPARTIATASHAALHDSLAVDLTADPFRLTIIVGGHQHTFQVRNGSLLYKSRWELSDRTKVPKNFDHHPPTRYDPTRFPPREVARDWGWLEVVGGWRAVVDRLGQVLLFRDDAGSLVAAFIVRRELAAAWMPGGVFWGDTRLIGGPAAPDAGLKLGQAIMMAERK